MKLIEDTKTERFISYGSNLSFPTKLETMVFHISNLTVSLGTVNLYLNNLIQR